MASCPNIRPVAQKIGANRKVHWARHRNNGFLSRIQSRKVWSLWEIMNQFDLVSLVDLFERMLRAEEYFNRIRDIGGESDDSDVGLFKELIVEASGLCEQENFARAGEVVARIAGDFSLQHYHRDYSGMATELKHAREIVVDELSERMFCVADTSRVPCPGYVGLIGRGVELVFPEAISDIMEASNCLIAGCHTAAVFHLMRIVEWGLRALCINLGLRRAHKRTKSGRTKYTPISYSDWETMLNQLQDKVDAKIDRMARGKKKQAAQEFYYPALQDIRAIRDAWRNHVMHTRSEYQKDDAYAILSHVKRLMGLLARNLKGSPHI